jgi:hypothetical protein
MAGSRRRGGEIKSTSRQLQTMRLETVVDKAAITLDDDIDNTAIAS